MRKVHVDVTVHMVLNLHDDEDVSDFISEMEYEFTPPEGQEGAIEDTEIRDHEVTDSR
jgi:hypothetical protein